MDSDPDSNESDSTSEMIDFDSDSDSDEELALILLCAAALLKVRSTTSYYAPRPTPIPIRAINPPPRPIAPPVRPAREPRGCFVYYQTMRGWDEPQFFKYTRMTKGNFENLLGKMKPKIARQCLSDGISAEERLVMALRYLSQGSSLQVLAWSFQIDIRKAHQLILETCEVIWEIFRPSSMKVTQQDWLNISEGFEATCKVPHCLGALDMKRLNVQIPGHNGSVVLLAVCDSKYKFTSIEIGIYGSQSDVEIFRNSVFGRKLEEGDFDFPEPSALPNNDLKLPYFFVANKAFPLKLNITKPYDEQNLSETQTMFNERLFRAQQVVENSFGILAARWQILKTSINTKHDVLKIMKTVIALHNFCQNEALGEGNENLYCPPGFADSIGQQDGAWRKEQIPLKSLGGMEIGCATGVACETRNNFADCLMKSGSSEVP